MKTTQKNAIIATVACFIFFVIQLYFFGYGFFIGALVVSFIGAGYFYMELNKISAINKNADLGDEK